MSDTVTHPTPMQAAARTNVHERLMAAIPHECQWKGDVCLTRVRLFRRAAEWSVELSKVGGASARIKRIAEERYRRALEDHEAHHCEAPPPPTNSQAVEALVAELMALVHELDALVDEACTTYRAATNADHGDFDVHYHAARQAIRKWVADKVPKSFAQRLRETE